MLMLAAFEHPPIDWISLHTVPLLALVAAALLYVRALGVLAERGRTVPRWQVLSFFSALAMIFVATQTAVDPISEHELVSMHMLQHLLIADLPGPLLLLGLRAPLLYFFWPRPVLVTAARIRPLRATWSVLRRPPVALSVWLALLVGWHIPPVYEAALASPVLHAVQHVCFAFGGMLAWWPILDPTHERLRARVWKALYVMGARMVGGVLGIVMIAWPTQLYGAYGNASEAWGIDPLTDQQIAGAMMMAVDFVIVTAAFFWLIAATGGPDRPQAQQASPAGGDAATDEVPAAPAERAAAPHA